MKKIISKILLVIFGIIITLAVLESSLRLGKLFFIWKKNLKNKIAIQGKNNYRIMCLGESTTALGGKYSFPSQLEKILNRRSDNIKFTVINEGIPATNSTAIVATLRDKLEKYNPDMVITMMGINDNEDLISYDEMISEEETPLIKKMKTYKLFKLLEMRIREKLSWKDFSITIDFCKSFRKRNPSSKKSYVNYYKLGKLYKKKGKKAKAIEIFKECIKMKPSDSRPYMKIGFCYEDPEIVKKWIKKAINADPTAPVPYAQLGRVLFGEKKYSKAEKFLRKAIELGPGGDWIYIDLASCYMRQKKWKEATKVIKRGLDEIGEQNNLYLTLANCYLRQDKIELFEKYLEKSEYFKNQYYNKQTQKNYRKLVKICKKRGVRVVCVEYPMRNIKNLKKIFNAEQNIIFVNNQRVFMKKVKENGYKKYFVDSIGGIFGHCTAEGNKLLASNIAEVILKKVFDINK